MVVGAPVCLTCLRPDSLNAEVSCWQDRKTVAVNCSEPMHRCAELLLRGSPGECADRLCKLGLHGRKLQ